MTDTKHTPGPWFAFKRGIYWTIATVTSQKEVENADEQGTDVTVAGIWSSKLEDEANARLIAAAPELLEACRRFVDYVDALQEPDDDDSAMANQARAAIAKATGK